MEPSRSTHAVTHRFATKVSDAASAWSVHPSLTTAKAAAFYVEGARAEAA